MKPAHKLRLGVNIDHVATVRNARGGDNPCPVRAAQVAKEAGADGITAHLREDRRHIRDEDIRRIRNEVALPLNFEMAATAEMQKIALEIKPNAVCLVPEKREERTTEGGLDVAGQEAALREYIKPFKAAGIRVSLFVDPEIKQIEAAKRLGADIVELHTGKYAETGSEMEKLCEAARIGNELGLEMHAGHGLTFENVGLVAAIPQLHELNIGHFLIGESIMLGMERAIHKMRWHMDEARA